VKKIEKMDFLENVTQFSKKKNFSFFIIKIANFFVKTPQGSEEVTGAKNGIFCKISHLAKIEKIDVIFHLRAASLM